MAGVLVGHVDDTEGNGLWGASGGRGVVASQADSADQRASRVLDAEGVGDVADTVDQDEGSGTDCT